MIDRLLGKKRALWHGMELTIVLFPTCLAPRMCFRLCVDSKTMNCQSNGTKPKDLTYLERERPSIADAYILSSDRFGGLFKFSNNTLPYLRIVFGGCGDHLDNVGIDVLRVHSDVQIVLHQPLYLGQQL